MQKEEKPTNEMECEMIVFANDFMLSNASIDGRSVGEWFGTYAFSLYQLVHVIVNSFLVCLTAMMTESSTLLKLWEMHAGHCILSCREEVERDGCFYWRLDACFKFEEESGLWFVNSDENASLGVSFQLDREAMDEELNTSEDGEAYVEKIFVR